MPDEIKNAPDNTTFNDTIERNGGVLPLVGIIGAIAAGITALSTAGGETANAILSAQKNKEDERHHKELESIARGEGI